MLSLSLMPSRIEFTCLLGCHAAALAALTQVQLAACLVGPLAVAVCGSLIHMATSFCSGPRGALQRIDITTQQSLLVYADQCLPATLPKTLFYSEWLLVVQFDALAFTGGQQPAFTPLILRLLPDSLSDDNDRKLRAYLRFARR